MLRHAERLDGVHPDLVSVVERAAQAMPFDLVVLEGLRTKARQEKLFAAGASQTKNSRHLTGHAVDLAPYVDADDDGTMEVSWDWPLYYRIEPVMKAAAEALDISIEWGGDWKFKDGPHWQLSWAEYPV